MKSDRQAGDSVEQRRAEPYMLARYGSQIGATLGSRIISIADGVKIQVDGISDSPPVLCEAYAHQGSLKPGQIKKVVTDAFKLAFVGSVLGQEYRKVILLASEDAAAPFAGATWYAKAFDHFQIEVAVVEIPDALRSELRAAQVRQRR